MLRWMTAGESHGPAILGVLEGMPAGVVITREDISQALARRRLGYGRGARMAFEADQLDLVGGIWRGATTGAPVALVIHNSEWPKWAETMSPDPGEPPPSARSAPLTRPRPGHADLAGMIKYAQADARAILERSSARETAARVAVGAVAAAFLRQALDIEVISHVVALGGVRADPAFTPAVGQAEPAGAAGAVAAQVDASPVRTLDQAACQAMTDAIDAAQQSGDTLGGVVEVIAYGVPPGLGSHVQWDRRLDARLAEALMSVQAVKAVEIGLGTAAGALPGSAVHDPVERIGGRVRRPTNHAGGIEGGMSNGEPVVARATIKPIPTLARALASIDTATGAPAKAIHQRSDVTAVPAAGVVAEAMVALVLADAALEKFGGDSLAEVRRNAVAYLGAIPQELA
ncbi:MAG: chorismate synthase [Bifidobacteriaceae bacterium]|nr:chorismate synthase [Bifidobacteriaceae bacterium]